MNITENYPDTIDPCTKCGYSTAFGSGSGLFSHRIQIAEGWVCRPCSHTFPADWWYECDDCRGITENPAGLWLDELDTEDILCRSCAEKRLARVFDIWRTHLVD